MASSQRRLPPKGMGVLWLALLEHGACTGARSPGGFRFLRLRIGGIGRMKSGYCRCRRRGKGCAVPPPVSAHNPIGQRLLAGQELVDGCLTDTIAGADLLGFELAGLDDGQHIFLANSHVRCCFG